MVANPMGDLERGRCGEWEALVAPAGRALCRTLAAGPDIQSMCTRVLRDDRRSFVGILERIGGAATDSGPIVAKSPREKDRRAWSRLTSVGGESGAFRTLRAIAALEHSGVPTPPGLLALERRWNGMVVESWLFTRFADAVACTAADVPDVLALLGRMHAAGWVHGDAHVQNFLRGQAGVIVLDPGPHRKRWGKVSEAYDLILLRNSRADVGAAFARAVPESNRRSAAFRIASFYDGWIHGWRRLKRAVRGGTGMERR